MDIKKKNVKGNLGGEAQRKMGGRSNFGIHVAVAQGFKELPKTPSLVKQNNTMISR